MVKGGRLLYPEVPLRQYRRRWGTRDRLPRRKRKWVMYGTDKYLYTTQIRNGYPIRNARYYSGLNTGD